MPLKVKIRYPKIDKGKTSDEVHNALSKAVTDAAKAWVIAATNSVPVWSGASKASFIKLASLVGVGLRIEPRPDAPIRIELGYNTSVGTILISRGRSYSFTWSSDLDYIHIVEGNHAFIEAGFAALRGRKFAKLPQPVIKRAGG